MPTKSRAGYLRPGRESSQNRGLLFRLRLIAVLTFLDGSSNIFSIVLLENIYCGASIPGVVYAGTLLPSLPNLSRKALKVLEARTGIEPVHGGFADLSVTTSPPGQAHITLALLAGKLKAYDFISVSVGRLRSTTMLSIC